MSALLAIGLILQAAALVVVFGTFGRSAFRMVGPAFIALAVLFHGVTELIQLLGLAPNHYRYLVPQEVVDEWVVLISGAILLMAVTYGLVLKVPVGLLSQRNPGVTVFRWQVLVIVAAPFYVVALAGRASAQETYWLGGLSSQFLTLAFVLASFDFIRRSGGRHLVPVLLVQSALLAPVGSRWSVVGAAVLTVWGLAFVGSPPTRRQALSVLAAAVAATVIISSARVAAITDPTSHFHAGSGTSASQRIDLMLGGVKALPDSWRSEAFWTDWVYRVDGNSLPALVRQAANDREVPPLGLDRLARVGLVAVPRVFYPEKLENDPTALSEKHAVISHYALTPNVDFLSPTLGMLYAYVGPVGLYIAALLVGVLFALFDRWLIERITRARLVIGVGVLLCVLMYEQGLQVYPLTLRGVISLLILATLFEVVWRPLPRGLALAAPSRRHRSARQGDAGRVGAP